MSLLERAHSQIIYPRRIDRLSEHAAALIPEGARVLDIGSGDGELAAAVARRRPDVTVVGVDVLIRPQTAIPTGEFNGRQLESENDSFDAALLIDVLHHAEAPVELLAEARRVAPAIVIKDHLLEGPLAERTLRLMDRTGNERYGVALPYGYWPRARWHQVFSELELEATGWKERLRLYPWPVGLVFDRSLHFIARLERRATAVSSP